VRVCFYHLDREWSARARIFADAAAALRGRGFEVTIVCARESEVARRFGVLGLETIVLRTDGGWLRAAWRLRSVLKRHFVEVIFAHSEFEQLAAAAAARLSDRGAVVRRVPALGRITMGRDARLAMRLAATAFLFSSPEDLRGAAASARALARALAQALEPAVAPLGVAGAEPRGASDARDGTLRTIAVIFDAAQRDRVSTVLRSVAMLAERHPELRCALIGPPGNDDALRIQAAALGIAEVVRWVADPGDRQDAIATADIAWLVAESDDLALGLLDCFARGVGVIADRTPLSTRFVTDGVEGILTSGLDAAGFASLFAALIADDQRRAALGSAASAAVTRWPVGATVDGFEQAATAARDRTRWLV
jgi:glycosyltransferase involved in cell wall biosynthesis